MWLNALLFLCNITLRNTHRNKGWTKDLTSFFSPLFYMMPPSFYFISCLLLSNGTAYCKCAAGFEGNGTFCTGKWTLFLPFWKIIFKKRQKRMLEALSGHSRVGERWALPYAPVKKQELLPVFSKQIAAQQVRIQSKQRAPNLQAARHCAEGEQRKGNMPCTTPAPLFVTFTPFPSKAQQREANSEHNNTSSYWKLCSSTISSAFRAFSDFWCGKIHFFRLERFKRPSERDSSTLS